MVVIPLNKNKFAQEEQTFILSRDLRTFVIAAGASSIATITPLIYFQWWSKYNVTTIGNPTLPIILIHSSTLFPSFHYISKKNTAFRHKKAIMY